MGIGVEEGEGDRGGKTGRKGSISGAIVKDSRMERCERFSAYLNEWR